MMYYKNWESPLDVGVAFLCAFSPQFRGGNSRRPCVISNYSSFYGIKGVLEKCKLENNNKKG